jgi:pyrroline-5-carboxylate reductase
MKEYRCSHLSLLKAFFRSQLNVKVGFIGAGKMAEAIIASFLNTRKLEAHSIFASDVSAERRRALKQQYGINVYSSNKVIPGMAEIVFLCVKPQNMSDVLAEIAENVTGKHLIISIAAGRKIAAIQAALPQARIVRVMPNLPCMVAEGMSAYCVAPTATADDKKTTASLLSCFGKVLELSEEKLDAVTAVSGSGPAFFAYLMDKIAEAGVKEGLTRADALLLAEQTMMGTAKLLMENKTDPQELIKSVASAKGTTAAGLAVLEKSAVGAILQKTITAAAQRSRELSS